MIERSLTVPFQWERREPYISNRTLFVPRYYFQHDHFPFPPFNSPELFGREAPIYIEYCSGNGDWVIDKALQFPEYNWIAVEKRFDRVKKIRSKLQRQQLANLIIVCGEALPFTQHYLKEGCIAGCFINFPDPWPKGRHAKHRLFQVAFIQYLRGVMLKDAKITIATDDHQWADQICQSMLQEKMFCSLFPPPYFVTDWPDYGFSYFDQLWRQQGKTIHYLQFIRGG